MVLSESTGPDSFERTHVVFNGLDLAVFDAAPAGNPLVPKTGDGVVIGCAMSRLTEQKGHVYLLEAAALASKRGVNARILLAGSGELEGSLRARVAELGLLDDIRLLGFVEDMKGFYASIDIFALPSLWEGFGYVLSEAMSMRLPVVAFDTSNIPEVVVAGETGLLAPARDVVLLPTRWKHLFWTLGTGFALVLQVERASNNFSTAKTSRALEDVLSCPL